MYHTTRRTTTDIDEQSLLELVGAAERNSEHPLAQAVVEYVRERVDAIPPASDLESTTGKGVRAEVDGRTVLVGSLDFLVDQGVDVETGSSWITEMEEHGRTVIGAAVDSALAGLVALADTMKEAARQTVDALKEQGLKVVLLTRDNERTAPAIAKQSGIREVSATGQRT